MWRQRLSSLLATMPQSQWHVLPAISITLAVCGQKSIFAVKDQLSSIVHIYIYIYVEREREKIINHNILYSRRTVLFALADMEH